MKKTLTIVLAFSSLIFAKSVIATQECEAYNNLKHTLNSGLVKIELNKEYKVLDEKRDNYYIRVGDISIPNRWVSKSCFKEAKETSNTPEEKKEGILAKVVNIFKKKDNNSNLVSLLVLTWHNSFCETHSNKKECRLNGGEAKNHLVLHGLWPQPRNNVYCGVNKRLIELDKKKMWNALPKLNLKPEVIELMQKYMPGFQSNLQRHEWIKHGTCYSSDPNEYFYNALMMTKRVDETIGEYFRANIGKRVKAVVVKKVAKRLIGENTSKKIAFKCKRVVLNELWISLKGKGTDLEKLTKDAPRVRSSCVEFIIDAPGRFRRR